MQVEVIFMWIIFGFLSLLFLIVSFLKKKTNLFILLSISCAALVLLNQYTIVNTWVNNEDWSALTDVVPTLTTILIVYVVCMIILNIVSNILYSRKEK